MIRPRAFMVLKWTVAAAFGGCVVQSFGYFVRNRERAEITYTSHYRKAISLARDNIGVEYLFGKPLEIKGIDLRNPTENFTQGKDTYLRVPLEGPKGKGSLFLHVNCEDGNFYSKDGCVLRRAECDVHETSELSEDKYKEKRLLIYDLNKHGPTDQNQ